MEHKQERERKKEREKERTKEQKKKSKYIVDLSFCIIYGFSKKEIIKPTVIIGVYPSPSLRSMPRTPTVDNTFSNSVLTIDKSAFNTAVCKVVRILLFAETGVCGNRGTGGESICTKPPELEAAACISEDMAKFKRNDGDGRSMDVFIF